MNQYSVFVALCIFGTAVATISEMICPANCIFKKCVDPCPKTCETLNMEELCYRKKCSPGCQCKDGWILSKGECIPMSDCLSSKCGKNSIYADSPCSATCADMFTHAPCVPTHTPGCQCKAGYYMNRKGECVTSVECSAAEVICPANSTFATCASSCPKNCKNQYLNIPCDKMCNIRCECNPGYIYNKYQECVLPQACTPEEVTCPDPDKIFKSCGKHSTCRNYYETESTTCEAGCFCKGVWDEETNSCKQRGECKNSLENRVCKSMDKNMQYYSSHPVEIATCKHPNPIQLGRTESGCYCKPGFVKNAKHKCVQVKDCCPCSDFE